MTESDKSISVAALFSVVILLAVAEMYFSYMHDRKHYKKSDTMTNIYLMAVAFVINVSMKAGTFMLLQYFYLHYRLFQITNTIIYWVLLVLAQDFLYWVLHYTGHYVRLFWDVRRGPTFADKLKYVFYPPGWSHDGSTQTARVMQQAFNS